MKFTTLCTAILFAAGLTLVGCDQSSGPDAPAVDDHAGHDHADHSGHDHGDHAEDHSDHAGDMGAALKEKTDEVVSESKKAADEMTEATKDKVDQIKQDLTPDTDASTEDLSLDSLEPGMSLSAGQADGYLAKIKSLISEENFELANTWITKLEGVNLPAGYGDKLAGLKSMLEKAQGASNALNNLNMGK